jgi:hypothetical protein
MIWLGQSRGYLSDWVTQQWVKASGHRVSLAGCPWLDGPVGPTTGVGPHFFQELAAQSTLSVHPGTGLIDDFSQLRGSRCRPEMVQRGVVKFYEQTAKFELDAWSDWCGAFRPFGWLLAVLFSRRLQQLNVPLSGLDTSHGVRSVVIDLRKTPEDNNAPGEKCYTAWVRQVIGSGNVLYCGSYSIAELPKYDGGCVKVVFPLPNGNAIVIMYPESNADGSISLTSAGKGFGEPGFYFTVHQNGKMWVRYVRAMQEKIRVYESGEDVRADHTLWLFGARFLRLHYRLRLQVASPSAEPVLEIQK